MLSRHDEVLVGNVAELEFFEDRPIHGVMPRFALHTPSNDIKAAAVYKPLGHLVAPLLRGLKFRDNDGAIWPRLSLREMRIWK